MILPRRDVSQHQWNDFVEAHPWGWFFHTTHWLEYCLAYHPGAEDCSFVIAEEGHIIALVPLIREGARFLMGGHPGAEPLLSHDIDLLSTEVMHEVGQLAMRHHVVQWKTRSCPCTLPLTGKSWETYVLDLRESEATLWRNFRRSYHGLVHKVQRGYEISTSATAEGVQLAHAVHRAAAHRETRPQRTWDIMAEWATDGRILTAFATNYSYSPPLHARGMAMAIRYKGAAYYASSGSIDKNVSPALIWELVRTLKQGGITAFEVGWAERPSDSDKEKGIAFFKKGFGGERKTVIAEETCFAG